MASECCGCNTYFDKLYKVKIDCFFHHRRSRNRFSPSYSDVVEFKLCEDCAYYAQCAVDLGSIISTEDYWEAHDDVELFVNKGKNMSEERSEIDDLVQSNDLEGLLQVTSDSPRLGFYAVRVAAAWGMLDILTKLDDHVHDHHDFKCLYEDALWGGHLSIIERVEEIGTRIACHPDYKEEERYDEFKEHSSACLYATLAHLWS